MTLLLWHPFFVYGLNLCGLKNGTVTNCTVSYSAGSGLYIQQGDSGITVTGGIYHHNGRAASGDRDGISIGGLGHRSTYVIIDGVESFANKETNLQMAATDLSEYSDHVTIRNSYFHEGAGISVQVGGPHTNVLLHHNVIVNSSNYGVLLGAPRTLSITTLFGRTLCKTSLFSRTVLW